MFLACYEPHKDIGMSKLDTSGMDKSNALHKKMELNIKLCRMNFTKDRLILLAQSAEEYKSHK